MPAAPAARGERFEAGDPHVSFTGSAPGDPDWKVDDVIETTPILSSAYRALNRRAL